MDYKTIANQTTTFEKWARAKSHVMEAVEGEKRLIALNLSNCGLARFEATPNMRFLKRLDLSQNALTEVLFGIDCPDLEFLNISYNQTALVKAVFSGRFPKLKYLYIYQSRLQKIDIAHPMPVLDTLNLRKNQLTELDLPKGFRQLVALNVAENQLPTFDLSLKAFPALQYLNLQSNTIENEMIKNFAAAKENCIDTLRDYQRQAEKHDVALDNECKVLLIGNGKAGKSCFVERLVNDRFEEKWLSTHAITIEQYQITDRKGKAYVLNLWDFGGQDIYHSTHRLFMQSNAIYLLFWDWQMETSDAPTTCVEYGATRSYVNYKLPYWLAYVRSQGKESPCIVIQTKMKIDEQRDAPNQSDLRAAYRKMIVAFNHIDSEIADSYENGYEDVLHSIEKSVRSIKQDSLIPKNCIAIRQAIRDLQKEIKDETSGRKLLPWSEYEAIAHRHGITDDSPINPRSLLETWLVKTGVVYYRNGLMGNQIILNQAWAIEAIYAIFDRKRHYYRLQKEQKGKLTGADFQAIWSPKFDEEVQELFLDFMLSCDLCYETTPPWENEEEQWRDRPAFVNRTFIVPQLLPDRDEQWIASIWRRTKESWYYRYEHEFLHYGIIQSFIIRAQSLAQEHNIWKMGILLEEGNDVALVEAKEKTITIRVNREGKRLLDKIINELAEIQQYEKGIMESVSMDGVNYVLLEKLRAADKNNVSIRAESGKSVSLQPLRHFLNHNSNLRLIETEQTLSKKQLKSLQPMEVNNIVALLQQGKLAEAVQQLYQHYPSQKTFLLSIKMNNLKEEEALGMISRENRKIERNEITKGILTLFESLTGQALNLTPVVLPKPQPPTTNTNNSLTKRKILFLAASPNDKGRTSADFEFDQIEKQINASEYKDLFNLQNKQAVDDDKLLKALKWQPEILHFSGHGEEEGIYIQDGQNDPLLVSTDTLEFLFDEEDYKKHLKTIVLNSCYSESQAKALSALGYQVIGIKAYKKEELLNDMAIIFASGFYLGLGAKESIKKACKDGKRKVLLRLGGQGLKRKDVEVYIWKDGVKQTI